MSNVILQPDVTSYAFFIVSNNNDYGVSPTHPTQRVVITLPTASLRNGMTFSISGAGAGGWRFTIPEGFVVVWGNQQVAESYIDSTLGSNSLTLLIVNKSSMISVASYGGGQCDFV